MDVARLSEYYPGFDFSELTAEEVAPAQNTRCLGTRVLVGPVIVGDFGSVINRRLLPELNLDPSVSLKDLPDNAPWNDIVKGVFKGFFEIFRQVQMSGQTSLALLNSCVRVDIAVSASPNFENCGRISHVAKRFLQSVFPHQPIPIVATTGVNALPQKSVLMMVAEFDAEKCSR